MDQFFDAYCFTEFLIQPFFGVTFIVHRQINDFPYQLQSSLRDLFRFSEFPICFRNAGFYEKYDGVDAKKYHYPRAHEYPVGMKCDEDYGYQIDRQAGIWRFKKEVEFCG